MVLKINFELTCCDLCGLGPGTLARVGKGIKSRQTYSQTHSEARIRWGFLMPLLLGVHSLDTAQGKTLASLEGSLWRPTIPAVNIQEEKEASVASLCTH